MKRTYALLFLLSLPILSGDLLSSHRVLAQDSTILEFEPKVGAIGSRVLIKTTLPEGTTVRFGNRLVQVLRETRGVSFVVPPGAATAFIEIRRSNRNVAKSAVPFVVSGTSLVSTPKLVGLKEAIDVFGYTEPRPEGGTKPDARPVLKLDDEGILTLGPSTPIGMGPAVDMQDASSAATRGMGAPGFVITARPPKKKTVAPTPAPSE